MRGEADPDVLWALGDGDRLNGGGSRHDEVRYSHAPRGVRVDLAKGTGRWIGAEPNAPTDHLSSIETVFGSLFDDALLGSSKAEVLDNNEGVEHEYMAGRGGDDRLQADRETAVLLRGGDGDDTVSGSSEADRLFGGAGRDRVKGSRATDVEGARDFIAGGPGADHLVGEHITEGSGAGADSIEGGPGNDTIVGELGDSAMPEEGPGDDIEGGTGEDVIFGRDGPDKIDGGDGNDTINGGVGDDSIDGMSGEDFLNGSHGTDTLDGGDGTDECVEGETVQDCEVP